MARLLTTLPTVAGQVSVHIGLGLLTCRSIGLLAAHDLATLLGGDSKPIVFPAPFPSHGGEAAVAPGRDLAVFTGMDAVLAVEPSGRLRWRIEHSCWARSCALRHREIPDDTAHRYADGGSAHFSPDGALVWAHVLGDDGEEWLVVDAATGEVLARAATNTDAHGSWHYPHPTDPSLMALALGEGQDAVPLLWGRFDGAALQTRRASDDRSHWGVGAVFLDERTAIACTNEDDVGRGPNRHWLVDLPAMSVRGPVVYPETVEGGPLPLGGGRRLTVGGRGAAKVWA